MASRAVLLNNYQLVIQDANRTSRLLLRNRHQVLGAQIVTESIEQLIVRRVWIHVRTCKWIDRRSEREGRHRPLLTCQGWERGREATKATGLRGL